MKPTPVRRLTPAKSRPVSLAARIRACRLELAALEQQQQDELRAAIVEVFARDVFSALQIWQQPALRAACIDAGITTVKQLGVWLRSWCGSGLARVCRDGAGIVWSVSADDLHEEPCLPIDDGV